MKWVEAKWMRGLHARAPLNPRRKSAAIDEFLRARKTDKRGR